MSGIELRIMGGLGNQLYQYSAARFVQSITNSKNIVIDIGGYDSYKIRSLELNSIINNHNVSFVKTNDLKNTVIRKLFHILQKMYNVITNKHIPMKVYKFGKTNYILSSIEFDKDMVNESMDGRFFMYGYFVSSSIALIMRPELKKEIVAPSNGSEEYKLLKDQIKKGDSIGISIRCGKDYEDNGWPICSKDFYLSALSKLIEMNPAYNIFVFADDMSMVIEQKWFAGYDVTYIENVSVCESFDLLRQCSAYVCSNSSFSWWGAFLSETEKPIIYNPNKVFAGDSQYEDKQTFYSDMILLDYQTGELI